MAAEEVRVLHVDDEPDLPDLTATFLERENQAFDVTTATNASEGLDVLGREPIDCVVSDYEMPGLNGIEFLETVRAEFGDLPFILYTGKGSEEVAADAISAGVTDYLQKGGKSEQYTLLANRIRNAVSGYRSKRELAAQNEELRIYERIFNTMQGGACLYDREGRFDVVNEYILDFYETTRAELEGQPSPLVEHIREAGQGDPFQELIDGERDSLQGEFEGDLGDRSNDVIEYRLAPLEIDGTIRGAVAVARVVTDHRRRERELEQTTTVLETVVEHHTGGLLVEDADREILVSNEALRDVFELSADVDLVGRDCGEAVEDLKDRFADPEGFVDGIEGLLAAREPVTDEELELADGRVVVRDYVPYTLPDGEANLWIYRQPDR